MIEEDPATTHTSSLQPPWKRVKRPFESQRKAITAFWDSLSKVSLTQHALKEHNRRNRLAANLVTPAPERRPDSSKGVGADCIKRFARHGGPDLSDLRGVSMIPLLTEFTANLGLLQHPEPIVVQLTTQAMPPSQSTSRTRSKSTDTLGRSILKTSTRKSSAYHRDFEQHLIDNRIYPSHYDFPDDREPQRPSNAKEILDRLAEPRPSLSKSHFSDKAFASFVSTNSQALTEAVVMRKLFPTIVGDASIPSAGELPFGNLEPMTDGTLVDAKPDFYDGALSEQIHQRVRKELSSYIIPSTQQNAPLLPNFFTEVKGPDGSAAVAKRQACINGALGARAMRSLQRFRMESSKEACDNNAYVITSTYHNGNLKLYTTHLVCTAEPSNPIEYHMTQIGGWDLTGSSGQFWEGASAFRNARDWAKEQRDRMIIAANGRAADTHDGTISSNSSGCTTQASLTNGPGTFDSETSADELALLEARAHKRQRTVLKASPDVKRQTKRRSSRASSRRGRGAHH